MAKDIGSILNSIENAEIVGENILIKFKEKGPDPDIVFILSNIVMEITGSGKGIKEYPKTLLKKSGLYNSNLIEKARKERKIEIPTNKIFIPGGKNCIEFRNEGKTFSIKFDL